MIKPVNGHIVIEPVPKPSFMQTERETYQEIGVVVDFEEQMFPQELNISSSNNMVYKPPALKKGDRVFFDSWLAAKFPKGASAADGYWWLVKWEDVRAVEDAGE